MYHEICTGNKTSWATFSWKASHQIPGEGSDIMVFRSLEQPSVPKFVSMTSAAVEALLNVPPEGSERE